MTADDPFRDCWFLTGPTASGKTAAGIALAQRLNAEIVSLDSMAVYRGLDIGTAKPTQQQRATVRHHLLDLLSPEEDFSAAQYRDRAAQAVEDIQSRGRTALFVGGTPLYLKVLLRGMFAGPEADWDLRRRFEAIAASEGPAALHDRLRLVDPNAAARLAPQDTRRVVRALEVFEKTGRPISDWQREFEHARPAANCRVFVLQWERTSLYERIDRRVEQMFADGLVAEVAALLQAGGQLGRTASQALGYREVLAHLAGQCDLAETICLVQQRTRQFAKRQLTWFRSLSECRWAPVTEHDTPADVATAVCNLAADS